MVAAAPFTGSDFQHETDERESPPRRNKAWSPWHVDRGYSPCERDLEIFRATTIDLRSQRDVAGEFKLSQTRVSQLVFQVQAWLASTSPKEFTGMPPGARLNLAEHIQRQRLERLYGLALEGWRQSCGPRMTAKTIHTPAGERQERTARMVPGEVRFLAQAARLVDRIAALDGVGRPDTPSIAEREEEFDKKMFDRLTAEERETLEPILYEYVGKRQELDQHFGDIIAPLRAQFDQARAAREHAKFAEQYPQEVACSEEEGCGAEDEAVAESPTDATPAANAASGEAGERNACEQEATKADAAPVQALVVPPNCETDASEDQPSGLPPKVRTTNGGGDGLDEGPTRPPAAGGETRYIEPPGPL